MANRNGNRNYNFSGTNLLKTNKNNYYSNTNNVFDKTFRTLDFSQFRPKNYKGGVPVGNNNFNLTKDELKILKRDIAINNKNNNTAFGKEFGFNNYNDQFSNICPIKYGPRIENNRNKNGDAFIYTGQNIVDNTESQNKQRNMRSYKSPYLNNYPYTNNYNNVRRNNYNINKQPNQLPHPLVLVPIDRCINKKDCLKDELMQLPYLTKESKDDGFPVCIVNERNLGNINPSEPQKSDIRGLIYADIYEELEKKGFNYSIGDGRFSCDKKFFFNYYLNDHDNQREIIAPTNGIFQLKNLVVIWPENLEKITVSEEDFKCLMNKKIYFYQDGKLNKIPFEDFLKNLCDNGVIVNLWSNKFEKTEKLDKFLRQLEKEEIKETSEEENKSEKSSNDYKLEKRKKKIIKKKRKETEEEKEEEKEENNEEEENVGSEGKGSVESEGTEEGEEEKEEEEEEEEENKKKDEKKEETKKEENKKEEKDKYNWFTRPFPLHSTGGKIAFVIFGIFLNVIALAIWSVFKAIEARRIGNEKKAEMEKNNKNEKEEKKEKEKEEKEKEKEKKIDPDKVEEEIENVKDPNKDAHKIAKEINKKNKEEDEENIKKLKEISNIIHDNIITTEKNKMNKEEINKTEIELKKKDAAEKEVIMEVQKNNQINTLQKRIEYLDNVIKTNKNLLDNEEKLDSKAKNISLIKSYIEEIEKAKKEKQEAERELEGRISGTHKTALDNFREIYDKKGTVNNLNKIVEMIEENEKENEEKVNNKEKEKIDEEIKKLEKEKEEAEKEELKKSNENKEEKKKKKKKKKKKANKNKEKKKIKNDIIDDNINKIDKDNNNNKSELNKEELNKKEKGMKLGGDKKDQ